MNTSRLDRFIPALLCIASFLLYIVTLDPSIRTMFDDSLEFQYGLYTGAILHPTGYPLYSILGWLWVHLIPIGEVAYRANLLAAICGAGAVAFLYRAIRAVRIGILPAIAGVALLAVSPEFWEYATVAEVYSLNALLLSATLDATLRLGPVMRDTPERVRKAAFWLAALVGLGLAHHRTFALALPGILIYLWLSFKATKKPKANLWQSIRSDAIQPALLALAIPAVLFLTLPLRAALGTTSVDGTYTNADFLNWILARQYAGIWLKFDLAHIIAQSSIWSQQTLQQYGLIGLLLGFLGFFALLWKHSRAAIFTLLIYLSVFAFTMIYSIEDVDVLFIPLHMMFAFWIAAALDLPVQLIRGRQFSMRLLPVVLPAIAALVLAGYSAALGIPLRTPDNGLAIRNAGIDMLSQAAPNATIVGIQGEMTLLRYLQQTQGIRTDVQTRAADSEEARLAALAQLVPSGKPVYLTRPLAGAPALYDLQSAGSLISVRQTPQQTLPQMGANAHYFDPPLQFQEPDQGGQPALALLAYEIVAIPPSQDLIPAAGSPVRLRLLWKVNHTPGADYKTSLRLVAPDGTLTAQTDALPLRGSYPTTMWRAGEFITDDYEISPKWGMPAGENTLLLALYRAGGKMMSSNQKNLVALGTVTTGKPRTYPPLKQMVGTDFTEMNRSWSNAGLTLLGIEGNVTQPAKAGSEMPVDLWMQATGKIQPLKLAFSFEAAGQNTPQQQVYDLPTGWQSGEILQLHYKLTLPRRAGDYTISVCLESTEQKCIPATQRAAIPFLPVTNREQVPLMHLPVEGRPYRTEPGNLPYTQEAELGTVAKLSAYNLSATQIQAGQPLTVTLEWYALSEPDTSYKVFVQMLDEQGKLVAQRDDIPCMGACPTSAWIKGEYLQDSYRLDLPPNLPAGNYRIILGMYDTQNRLPVTLAGGKQDPDRRVLLEKTIVVVR